MTPAASPTSASPLPVLTATLVSAVALVHLLFGTPTAPRTILAVLAVVTAAVVGGLAARPQTPPRLVLAMSAVGLGAAAMLGVTYL